MLKMNATAIALLGATMAILSALAAASWNDVLPHVVVTVFTNIVLALNAGLHAVYSAAQLIGGGTKPQE